MNHLVIVPVLLPLVAALLLLSARRANILVQRAVALTSSGILLAIAITLLLRSHEAGLLVYQLGNWPAPFGIVLVADRLAAWMVLVTAALAPFALLHASGGSDCAGRHFHAFFQLQLFGLNGAFLTGDLFNLFVFFEILLLASYGLLLHGGGAARIRAGLHYVVINLVGSTLFLFAVGTLYGVLGTLNMADLALRVAATPPENVGLVRAAGLLLLVVFGLKAALVPLYLWLPRAYAHTGAAVAALFAIMTKVGAYSILRLHTLVFGPQAGPLAGLWEPWLLPLALATLALGMLGAMASTGLRQQIAYLVVASAGTLLTAFGLGGAAAIGAGLYYLAHSTFAAAAFFLLADVLARHRGAQADSLVPGTQFAQWRLLGGLFLITAMVIAGIPPLSGFLGKYLLLHSAMAHPAMPWVFGVVLGSAVLGVITLARSGDILFFQAQPPATAPAGPPATPAMGLSPVLGLLGLGLLLTLWSGAAVEYTQATAAQLVQPGTYTTAVLGGAVPEPTR